MRVRFYRDSGGPSDDSYTEVATYGDGVALVNHDRLRSGQDSTTLFDRGDAVVLGIGLIVAAASTVADND